jgi:citrate synthase
VHDLASQNGFEAVGHLLWQGTLPDPPTLASLRTELGRKRVAMHRLLADRDFQPLEDPMDSLRAALAQIESTADPQRDKLIVAGAAPVANAWWWAHKNGLAALEPDPEVGTAADYLRLITRETPTDIAVRSMDRYLVTVSDHGMNASTFTARVIASTRSDLVSAVVGAVGALKGPLHGGAPGPVLDMLDAIGTPEAAGAWLRSELEAGRRIMGMGHRIYRVRDPRAAVFEQAVTELKASGDGSGRLALARAVEAEAEEQLATRYPGRSLKANVEFYTAVLLEALGVPRQLFSATFAVGRMAGWIAHYLEQREEDRLIRPRSQYVGPAPGEAGRPV